MMFIAQHSRSTHFLAILASAALCLGIAGFGCSLSDDDPNTAARSIGSADVPDRDLELIANSGTFRSVTENEARLRSSAPVLRLGVQAGNDAEGTYTVDVENVHPATRIRVLSVSFPDASQIEGCPTAQRESIPCADAEDAIGEPCAVPADCVAGLTCLQSSCQPATSFAFCTPPPSERGPDQETSLELTLDVEPCTSIQYGVELTPEEEVAPLRFAAIGSTESLGKLDEAVQAARSEGELDFVAVLGENVEDASVEGVDALADTLRDTGVPIVYVAGGEAVSFDNGAYTLRKLGPHDQAFAVKGVRFATVFTAQRELGNRGLQRLETFLRQVERLGDGPAIVLTHTVPIDPNGVRNQGFKNRTEGARMMSLLREFDIDYLFSGRIPANESETIADIEAWITSAETTLIRTNASYLEVTAAPASEQESRTISVRRIQF